LLENICTICNNKKFLVISKKVRDSKKHKIIKCKKCDHIQLFPTPTEFEEKEFYDENLQDKNIKFFGGIKENRIKSIEDTKRRVDFVKLLIPKNGKILEIGSGHGFFIESMEKLNYNITGIEISKNKRKLSKRITKSKILNVNLINELPNIKNLDAIVLFHVLEHLSNPSDFLKKISIMLKSNGKIILEVPNSDDNQLNSNFAYKEFYWQRGHLHYFNPRSLKTVISKAGFKSKILGIQRYSIENMINWKLTNKPQINFPTFSLEKPYEWIDVYYKKTLEKSLKCDTIIAICNFK
jgi:2-polyprenyl-3-methyl-5-hydroxy-6-metoxy-1,4-benzoquinol methylase